MGTCDNTEGALSESPFIQPLPSVTVTARTSKLDPGATHEAALREFEI